MNHIAVATIGMAGAAVPEIMRAIAALRAGRGPSGKEIAASGLSILLGLGVLLFDPEGDSALQVAVLGAAFPQLFSGLVAAAKPPESAYRSSATATRSVWDYWAWRV